MEFYISIIVTSAMMGMLTTLYFIIRYGRLAVRGWVKPLKVESLMRFLKTALLTIVSIASLYAAAMLILIILRIRLAESYYGLLTSVMAGLLLASIGFVIGALLTIGVGEVITYLIRRLTVFSYIRMDISKDIKNIRNNIHELTLMLREHTKRYLPDRRTENEV